MKFIAALAVVLTASVAATPAWAELVQYGASIEFQGGLHQGGLPKLRVGDPADDQDALPGMWFHPGDATARSAVSEQIGVRHDPSTGQSVPVWGAEQVGGQWGGPPDSPQSLPTAGSTSDGFLNQANGFSVVSSVGLSTSGLIHDFGGGGAGARVTGASFWERGFVLDPFGSFTLTGLGIFGIVNDPRPLELVSGGSHDESRSFASVTLGDVHDRVSAFFGVQLGEQFASSLRDIVSYSVSPDGLMSLTVTNHTAGFLDGFLQAGTRVDGSMPWAAVAAPLPEPATVAMMVAGVGLIGVVARRRRVDARQTSSRT